VFAFALLSSFFVVFLSIPAFYMYQLGNFKHLLSTTPNTNTPLMITLMKGCVMHLP